jgi:hypothetical protein
MWNMKCFVIPVVIWTTVILTKGIKKIWKRYQETIQQIHYKKKTAVLGTLRTIRKVLQSETWSLSGGGTTSSREAPGEREPVIRDDIIIINYYIIILCSRVLLEKLTDAKLIKKFPAFYGIRICIIVFTWARHWALSWEKCLTPYSLRPVLILSTHLCLRLPNGLFPEGFTTVLVWLSIIWR